jgi:predicted dehydrogenase
MTPAATPPLRVGVVGCSRFAVRSMIPAIAACDRMRLAAVASRSAEKAAAVAERFDCAARHGYGTLLEDDAIDAVYVPLPTGLHEEWVTRALAAGKHALVEKSFALDAASAERMVAVARERDLLVAENFLFPNHSQTAWVLRTLTEGGIGDPLSFRLTFCFPHLAPEDIRYRRELGGGALYDAGCYTVRAARTLLGDDVAVVGSRIRHDSERGVDVRGAALLADSRGRTAHLAWGFGMQYVCAWDVLGSDGRLTVERAFTPPPGHAPTVHVRRGAESSTERLPADDHFANMCARFAAETSSAEARSLRREEILGQARLMDAVRRGGAP